MKLKTKMALDVGKLVGDPPALWAYLLLCASERPTFAAELIPHMKWVAMDKDGDWFMYETKPVVSIMSGVWLGESTNIRSGFILNAPVVSMPWDSLYIEVKP